MGTTATTNQPSLTAEQLAYLRAHLSEEADKAYVQVGHWTKAKAEGWHVPTGRSVRRRISRADAEARIQKAWGRNEGLREALIMIEVILEEEGTV